MVRFRASTRLILCTALLTIGRTAAADPVQITSGYIQIGGSQDPTSFLFLSTIAYQFTTAEFVFAATEREGFRQNVFEPNLFTLNPGFFHAADEPLGENARASGRLTIATTATSTPAPFQLTGALSIVGLSGASLFSGDVFGEGTARFSFAADPNGRLHVSGVTYQFENAAATPEPATCLLLASGLVVLALRRFA